MLDGDDAVGDTYYESELLTPEESLDEDEMGDGINEGYSPNERPLASDAWGTTATEESGHESLVRRLASEEPDVADLPVGDGLGDASDTDGELIDREAGDLRAGRLVADDVDPSDSGSDFRAFDAGIDGAGASAEEAAMHVLPDDS